MTTDQNERLSAVEAEKSVLGTILLDGLPALDLCRRLRPEHFYLQSHRVLFSTFHELLTANMTLDDAVLRDRLGKELQSIGGFAYLSSLSEGIFHRFDPSQRVDLILEKWRVRRGIALCESNAQRFHDGQDSAEVLADLQAEVFDAMNDNAERDNPAVCAYSEDAFADLMERATGHNDRGLSYGLQSLDDWTGGLHPGQVTVVGARSGVGKTSLMKQTALASLRKGIPVSMFSLEAPRQEILESFWAIEAGVSHRRLVFPKVLTADERERLKTAKDVVAKWPLRIYDRAELNLSQVVAFARMDVRQHGTRLVCVDYAQSVEGEGKDERTRVANVSRRLTKMAKTEKCSLMLLSQLRKVPHEAYSHPPTAADLRETDQLNNDAHVILLLHRGWDDEEKRISNEGALLIPKNRRGPTGALSVRFQPASLTFEVGA